MKQFQILNTDFYQISMATAYILLNQANNKAGFEAFVRNIKSEVCHKQTHYIFDGEKEVNAFIVQTKKDIRTPEFLEAFIKLIEPKISDEQVVELRTKWNSLDKEFSYSIYPSAGIVKPHVPVFQFYGPIWIGQLLETPILNIINGRTGRATCEPISTRPFDLHPTDEYQLRLIDKARAYRKATTKHLIEAGLRRAPSFDSACLASKIALEHGWNGTSNTGVIEEHGIDPKFVNGTMAHSFVMSQSCELIAFDLWNKIFPYSTFLIDTYNPINAAALITQTGIRPKFVRIDSEPLEEYCFGVRRLLDLAGWKDVGIIISGDLTVERLIEFEEKKIPFDKCLVGTKYVNIYPHLNPGFVYKLVQIEDNYGLRYPEKKSIGKINYSGLKYIDVDCDGNIKMITKLKEFGLNNIHKIYPLSTVQ